MNASSSASSSSAQLSCGESPTSARAGQAATVPIAVTQGEHPRSVRTARWSFPQPSTSRLAPLSRLAATVAVAISLAVPTAQAEDPQALSPGEQAGTSGLVAKEGRYVRLITDLPESPELAEWVTAFDAAVPQWAAHFGRDLDAFTDWRVTGFLMADKTAFVARGLVPPNLPEFRFGFQAGSRIWVLHQPTAEYTRHLLLHEGVHAAGFHLFGGCGPPWLMEGVAEYLATHDWNREATPPIRVGVIPRDPLEVAGWGRIELIEEARTRGQVPRLETVMKYSDIAHREVAPYAWSWLAVTLLETYPEYRRVLRESLVHGRDSSPQFNRRLYEQLRSDWPILTARWWLLAHDIEYGWDADLHRVALPLPTELTRDTSANFSIRSDRGWQSAPIRLAAGQSVRVEASGRYVIRQPDLIRQLGLDEQELDATAPARDWESEPGGVTIRYHRGQPIGKLLACVLPMRVEGENPNLPPLRVEAIGEAGELTATSDSWLLFCVNEPADQRFDNRGGPTIRLRPTTPAPQSR